VEEEVESSSLPLPQILAENSMTEERKHAILFAATLLCARKLVEQVETDKSNLAKQYFVDKPIEEAAFILERIDKKYGATPNRRVHDGRFGFTST
jgi:hypothetical protein